MTVDKKYLYYQHIKRIVDDQYLSTTEQINLCYFYNIERYGGKYTKEEVRDSLFHPKMRRYKEACLENARRYFRKELGMPPKKMKESAVKGRLKEGELIYDKDYNLYSWEKGKFHRVDYFE